jgi:hypothetical protein
VLSRHLTFFAVLEPSASTTLKLQVMTPRRLWLRNRPYMAVRILLTGPARVTGSFVGADGSVVPGQVVKTPTRHAGATVLRVPVRVSKPGVYRLQLHADGLGQVVDRTARIRFVATRPASPLWQDAGTLQVVVINGVRLGRTTLGKALGPNYVVRTVSDAELYAAVNPNDPHGAAAVVVDLGTVPLPSLASLHALLPELRIIGVTDDRALAADAHRAGIQTVLEGRAPTGVVKRIRSLIPRR